MSSNIEYLELAVAYLDDLVSQVVFVGGCVTDLLITDQATLPPRVTQDVDAIIEVNALSKYYQFIESLREKGFSEDTRENAPICRYVKDEVTLDVMPTDSSILGLNNKWFPEALQNAESIVLPSGIEIQMITAPYFLGCKFEAFNDRGKDDYLLSHDLEDIILIIDGRPTIVDEVRRSNEALKTYIGNMISELLQQRDFFEALPGLLPNDPGSQARSSLIISRSRELRDLIQSITDPYEREIRRIDSNFKERYPFSKTRIFLLSNQRYGIYYENISKDYEALSKEFKNEIGFITSPVCLLSVIPEAYLKELPPLSDAECISDVGLVYTQQQLIDLFLARFIYLRNITFEFKHDTRELQVIVPKGIREDQKEEIIAFASQVQPYFSPKIIPREIEDIKRLPVEREEPKSKADKVLKDYDDPILFLFPHQRLPTARRYFKDDDEFWFDSRELIVSGKMNPADFPFYSRKPSCYVDFTVFENINLRNQLMLYDTIYLTPPLREKEEQFTNDQHFRLFELYDLIAAGRVKIVLKQPIERLDIGFIDAVNEIDPKALIHRRALASICLADIANIKSNFEFSDDDFLRSLAEAIPKLLSDDFPKNRFLANFLSWPATMIRNANHLFNAGTRTLGNFGVSKIIRDVDEKLDHLSIDLAYTGEHIHIAHALNAHYFPITRDKYTNQEIAILLYSLLDLYSSPNRVLSSADNNVGLYDGVAINDIFGVFEKKPIVEFAKVFEAEFMRKNVRSLLSELSSLSATDRNSRIDQLNREIRSRKNARSKTELLISLAKNSVGAASLPIGLLLALIEFLNILSKTGAPRQLKTIIEEKCFEFFQKISPDKAEISFIDKISSVAVLTRTEK